MSKVYLKCPACGKSVDSVGSPDTNEIEVFVLGPYRRITRCHNCRGRVVMRDRIGGWMYVKHGSFLNRDYTISRRLLLKAIGIEARFYDHKIPVGQVGEWKDVWVSTGWDGTGRKVYLPRVILKARGVANRLQAECPKCGKVMRFCGLQQHVGSKTCQEQATKDEVSGTFTHNGITYSCDSEMVETDYGPENKVRIWEWGTDRYSGWLYQESASTKTVISWFKDMLDDIEEHKKEVAEQDCIERGESMDYTRDASPPFGLQEENR